MYIAIATHAHYRFNATSQSLMSMSETTLRWSTYIVHRDHAVVRRSTLVKRNTKVGMAPTEYRACIEVVILSITVYKAGVAYT